MRYKMTKQFARDNEAPLAEFNDLNDAMLFVNKKSALDDDHLIKIIYRVFDGYKLLRAFNLEKISIPVKRAQYAEGDIDLPMLFAEPFRVSTVAGEERGKFILLQDATDFVQARLAHDVNNNLNETYLISEGKTVIEQMGQASNEGGSQGQDQKVAFRPTPFAAAPRVGPPKWLVDEDEKGEDKE